MNDIELSALYVKEFIYGRGEFCEEAVQPLCGIASTIGTISIRLDDAKRYLVAVENGEAIYPSSENDIETIRQQFIKGEINIHVSEEPAIGFYDSEIFKYGGKITYVEHDQGF